MTDAEPIPAGTLPRGWVSAGAEFAFENPTAGLAVRADRRTDDADAGIAGAPTAWRVWYERRVGETTECRTVGTVCTREEAVDGLLRCMRRVSDGGAEGLRWVALSTLASEVTLRDAVPTADGGVDDAAYAASWAAKLDAGGRDGE